MTLSQCNASRLSAAPTRSPEQEPHPPAVKTQTCTQNFWARQPKSLSRNTMAKNAKNAKKVSLALWFVASSKPGNDLRRNKQGIAGLVQVRGCLGNTRRTGPGGHTSPQCKRGFGIHSLALGLVCRACYPRLNQASWTGYSVVQPHTRHILGIPGTRQNLPSMPSKCQLCVGDRGRPCATGCTFNCQ